MTAPRADGSPAGKAAAGESAPPPPDRADQLAAAVLAVPGVAGLHGGMFGEAATYLPGRKVAGIRLADTGTTTVHVTVVYGRDIDEVAAAVRRAAAALIDGPVDVVVEDVAVPGADPLTEIARPSSPQPWSTA
ncbi:hypothetical protein [Rhodococcus sp. X156]|uniref:hypothetical protein n=1 Tax=Rhodococcus sp. X156 TaxID=2499145 RepID=UPI0032174F39